MKSKIDINLEGRFFKNRALAAAGARFFRIWGSKLEQKPIKDRSKSGVQDGMHLGIDF